MRWWKVPSREGGGRVRITMNDSGSDGQAFMG